MTTTGDDRAAAVPALPEASTPPRRTRLPHLPGLDGVRAIAVAAVLLFHLPQQVLPGGFLGVDVFFVLSGFLITSLLLGELEATGRIRFGSFYLRRARRLLPALLAVLVVTAVLVLTVARDAAATFREDAIAAVTYTTNWWYVVDDRSYFDVLGRPPMLQHLWSLGIEEQFYLVWPSVALLAWRRWGRRGVGVVAVCGALTSTALMAALAGLGGPGFDTSRLYFGSDTHAMTVLVGAALAVAWRPAELPKHLTRSAGDALNAAGALSLTLLLIVFASVGESSTGLYQGGFLLVAVITAVLIMAASHPAARFGRLLGTPVMRWLGTRSYGIYLWHWPIFLVTRPDLDLPVRGWWASALSLALTFGAAEASYRWIEMPVRRGDLARWWTRVRHGSTRLRAGAAGIAVAATVTLVAGGAALAVAPAVDSSTYLGGVTQTGAGTLTPREGEPGGDDGRAGELPYWQRRITAVGDSVLLGARDALTDTFPHVTVDAAIGRQPVDIADRVRERLAAGRLGDVLIYQTGTNGPPDPQGLRDFLKGLDELDRIVVVTVRSQVPWMDASNSTIRGAAQGLENVVVADWARESVGHPEYLYSDGTHLTDKGRAAYVRVILDAVKRPDPGESQAAE